MSQKYKDVFGDPATMDTFTQELYKRVRNNIKKVDQANKIQELVRNKQQITEEQQEKLKNKSLMIKEIEDIVGIYKIYKRECEQREKENAQVKVNTQEQAVEQKESKS